MTFDKDADRATRRAARVAFNRRGLASAMLLPLLMVLAAAPASAQAIPPVRPRPQPAPPNFKKLVEQFEKEKGLQYMDRTRTLNQFGRVHTEECARYVTDIIRNDKDPNIRRYAITALGQVGGKIAREQLLLLLEHQDRSMRSNAAVALARVKPPLEHETWAKLAEDDDYAIQSAGIRGLAGRGDAKALRMLIGLLRPCPPGMLRHKAGTPEQRMNQAVLRELRSWKGEGLVDMLHAEVLKQGRGKLLWRKRVLLPIATMKPRPEDRDVYIALLDEKDPRIGAAAVDGLDCKPMTKVVVDALIEALDSKWQPQAVAAAVVLGKHGPDGAARELVKAAKSRDPGLAAAATEALAGYPGDADAVRRIEKGLKNRRHWQIVAAAISAIRKLRTKESLEWLIDALKRLDGRLRFDCVKALRELTGQDLGDEHKFWKDWWKVAEPYFKFPEEATAAKPKDERKGTSTVTRNPVYYGTEVVSRRVAFIVDFSGSMGAKMKDDEGQEVTRIELARQQLMGVVKALPSKAYFNLVFFGTSFKAWQKTVTKASNKAKGLAFRHIKGAAMMGGTNIYDPLEATMQDPNVDTIYLLSDGSPGSGKFTTVPDILREIKRLNATKRIVIHTISFGQKSELMEKLAKQNGGNYIER